MKKINLIEWLSRNSHEKQKPQRFVRYAAMLIMLLTLGVGQMWADCNLDGMTNVRLALYINDSWDYRAFSNEDNNHFKYNAYFPANTTYYCQWNIWGNNWTNTWYIDNQQNDNPYIARSGDDGTVAQLCFYANSSSHASSNTFTTANAASGYTHLYIDYWGKYNKYGWNGVGIKFWYVPVDALDLTSISSSPATVISNGTTTLTYSGASGGSGEYSIAYSASSGSCEGSTFIAPYVFSPTDITITGTLTDANSQLSGLIAATKTTTVRVNRPNNMYIKHDWTGASGWSWQTATGNGDGTYSYVGEYHASGCDWNVASSETNKSFIADGSCTKVGAPTSGDICTFKLAPTEWSAGGSKEASVTIIKRLAVTATKVSLGNGAGSEGTPNISATSYADGKVDYNTSVTFTAPTEATGYRWKGWYTNSAGTGDAYKTSKSFTETVTSAKTYYAIYEPITYSITFNINGGDSWESLGSASESAGVYTLQVTYDQVLNSLTMPHAIKNAKHFKCWSTETTLWEGKYPWMYDNETGEEGWHACVGYVNKDGDNYIWKKADNITLYAHYYDLSIPRVTFSPQYVVPEEDVTATVEFSSVFGNPEGSYTLCYTLTTASGVALQVQPEWRDKDDATHTVTFTAPGSPGDYSLAVKLFPGTGDVCGGASPAASFDGNSDAWKFQVEDMNPITIQYKCGSADVSAPTTARATWSNPATVTAPDIPGLQFVNWTLTSGAIYFNEGSVATNKTVSIKALGSGTLTANYTQGSLFFKNTLNWDHVYVYFYNSTSYWTTSSGNSEGTGSKRDNSNFISGPHEMTLLEGTDDVYYYAGEDGVPAAMRAVAFSKEKMGDMDKPKSESPGYDYFAGPIAKTDPCHVVYVNAFDANKPMIVPVGNGKLWNLEYARYYAHDLAPLLPDWGYDLRGDNDIIGWSPETDADKHKMKAAKLGDLSFSTDIYFDNVYASKAWKIYNGNKGYGRSDEQTLTYTSQTSNPLANHDDSGWNLNVQTNIAGNYTFTLNFGTDCTEDTYSGAKVSDANGLMGHMTVKVTYPVDPGDFRLVYIGGAKPHPGNVIKKRANGEDIVSMYVAAGQSGSLKVQPCSAASASSVTWTGLGSCSAPTYADGINFASILSEGGAGTYNFTITQDENKVAKITNVEKYTGRFYVRTNCVDDKWNYKLSPDKHAMTYSEWSEKKMEDADMRFSHYYVDDLHGTSGSPINIRFTVATDYSEAICDTVFEGDADGKWKDYIHSESLQRTANVRFTYDQNRNKVWRAYTEGPENDNYMVLRSNGSDVFAVNGSGGKGSASAAIKFDDLNNWVYQVDAYANVGSYVKLTADINSQTQYIKGVEGDGAFDKDDGVLLVGGSSDGAQHMRITYDFKTDRMMTSWLPNGPVSGTLDIHADIMLLRTHQDGASSITFNTGGKLTDVKTAYGVMEFQKDYINDYSLSRYERNLYWISFPFDVNLSDVFGFGKYGEHWIIEYYDGKGRAEKGYWAESEPNWKFVTEEVKDEFVLKANEGYILALALSNMTEYSDIWANSVTSVYLYFPSANTIGNLSNVSSVTVKMDTVGYKCKITRDNRHIKDSYWRCIGVPSYALSTRTGLPTSAPDNWETKLPYVYIWNSINNSLAITSSDEVNFEAMHSYLIQYPDGEMVWTNVTNVPAGVMRRRVEGHEASFYEWNLNLSCNGEHMDHTYVRLTNDENATANFDFGQDLSKEFNSGSNIYTFVDDVEVAGNVKPIRTETTIVPVGVKIATTGEYTFSMPEGTNGVGVILVDNIAGTRTNLALEDYTINLTQGNIDNRFFLEISPIVQSPTDIEQTNSDSKDGVRKVMVDGILYIVKDGKVFDAQGNRIK